MPGAGKKQMHKNIGKLLRSKTGAPKLYKRRPRKPKSRGNTLGSLISKKKLVDFLTSSRKNDFKRKDVKSKATKALSNQLPTCCQNEKKKLAAAISEENAKPEKADRTSKKLKPRRKRRRANEVTIDEASRLQRRTRYLLVKMKLEQNLLDAYSTEGWKGQSREKIKPEKELQRARKQILKCKLGIRETIRQLDLLSSDGCIDDSVIAPDGSVHHDHIHCAKCKLREAFPDNDIVLCDGTCNCAFHQMCIDPPLLTENIPPGDQGWFCKYCICKMEIMESMNAQLGTSYPDDCNWQEIFKVEATLPDGGDAFLDQQEWPSDDSEDDDYDPKRVEKDENNCSHSSDCSEGKASDNASSNCSLWSLEEEVSDDEYGKSRRENMGLESTSATFIGAGSDSDCEIVSGRRQRRAVDYRQLYDEMFGKDALANDQVSEDEDWGPTKRKRREKESDAASTLMTLCEPEEKCINDSPDTTKIDANLSCKETKRSLFRIPAEAVEKLRLVFAENELPSRAVKEDLSKQLGLDSEKVSKWFKNARYLALKTRKAGEERPDRNKSPIVLNESGFETGKDKATDQILSQDMPADVARMPKSRRPKKFRRRKNPQSPGNPLKEQQDNGDVHLSTSNKKVEGDREFEDDDVSLKMLREKAKKEKKSVVVFNDSSGGGDQQQGEQEAEAETERLSLMKHGSQQEEAAEAEIESLSLRKHVDQQKQAAAEAEMERLSFLKRKLEKLQRLLLQRLPNRRSKNGAPPNELTTIVYVPVAELKEKS